MTIAEYSIQKRTITWVMTVFLLIGGSFAYQHLGRLEDPEFTIKDALVITPYPGATPREVEQEVTDLIERAAQQMGQLKRVTSKSEAGLSTVTVTIKDKYSKTDLPQVWNELRHKIGDVQHQLPPGAGPSFINDDYGDVYGVFFALYGDGFTMAELEDVAKFLRHELLLVRDVKRIEFMGVQQEVVYVEIARETLAQLGIPEQQIYEKIGSENIVTDAGHVTAGPLRIALEPTRDIRTVEAMENIVVGTRGDSLLYLRDIANITRGYKDPPDGYFRYNGHPSIGIGISTVDGGNVVVMGHALEEKMREIAADIPLGIEFGIISLQSETVTKAISDFITNLMQAIAIVIIVLLFFMGIRSGLIIGAVLLVTIVGSFIVMDVMDILLQRISLGALVIALGMLVDNAIVVCDGMMVRMQRGTDATDAAREVVTQNQFPLLGATLVAIFAFGPIGLSQDNTGEYCRSLFQVLAITLMMSWVTALTLTPLLCATFLRRRAPGDTRNKDPYDTRFYHMYRAVLRLCIRFRWVCISAVIFLLIISGVLFTFLDKSFFPPSTRPQFMVDVWLPAGTDIRETHARILPIESYLAEQPHVTDVSTYIGGGMLRFILTYPPERPDPSYVLFVVSIDDYHALDELVPQVQNDVEEMLPDAIVAARRFLLGPNQGGRIQVRFSGPDDAVLRTLAQQTKDILAADPDARTIRTDWRPRVPVIRPVLIEEAAQRTGITRPMVATTLRRLTDGVPIGVYREGDKLLPILARSPARERREPSVLKDALITSPIAGRMMPLQQIISSFENDFTPWSLWRRDRQSTLTVHADQRRGTASALLARVKPQIDALPLPEEHRRVYGGEYEDSRNAQAGLAVSGPVFLLFMVLITIFLFNSLRQPLIIWLVVPCAIIGVTFGLLVARQPFGFMTLLGVLSLSGMLIKNVIVLLDEIRHQCAQGVAPYEAVLTAGVCRMRPVCMAAATTVLGMIPLLQDDFFIAMAVAIMSGLTFATALTLLLVPVLYCTFFRIPYDPSIR